MAEYGYEVQSGARIHEGCQGILSPLLYSPMAAIYKVIMVAARPPAYPQTAGSLLSEVLASRFTTLSSGVSDARLVLFKPKASRVS